MKLIIKTILLTLFIFGSQNGHSGEGMWLPQLLKALNEGEMQTLGMKMTAEQIYSVNQGSLKDAIVHFGGFCTSELISPNGLLLTNHHCGYGQIQSHSSLENNYLKNGFWAKSHAEELPNPGLSATFIVRIEDVTSSVLEGVTDELTSKQRQSQIDKNLDTVKSQIRLKAHEDVKIRPFFKGNQYFLFVTMTYNDVRLVGAPPESIGKFGSDTDNWVWPRHTGDFSLFRIYAGKDNLPAEYSEENVPYQPKHFLPISVDGVAEGDFTLVFGFPGRTDQYLPSPAVEQLIETLNPAKIAIRDKALKIIDVAMRNDEATRIQYASKFARIANYWKKWIGESQGLKSTGAVAKKKKLEAEFQKKVDAKKTWTMKYGHLLPDFETLYKQIEPYALTRDYYNEVVGRNIEIMRVAGYMDRLVKAYEDNGEAGYDEFKGRLANFFERFYKNYRPEIDQKVFGALMEMYANADLVEGTNDPVKAHLAATNLNSYDDFAKHVFGNSLLTNHKMITDLMGKSPKEFKASISKDELYIFAKDLKEAYNQKVGKHLPELQPHIDELQRLYMEALMEVFPNKRFYPDANSTMRVTYGQINGYEPRDAVVYQPVTYLSGVMEKYQPGDYEFDVPQKLIDLYEAKDYGNYGTNGKMPVCNIGSNHTTGGNSGSPAIDAHGNLIGLNFDRVWEGTMSDINYDSRICRNIMVDARYILFIIDKFAGAKHLIDEMKLVKPKHSKVLQTR